MARVGRLAGAILAETGGELYLVGHTKVPCEWATAGFERPPETDSKRPIVRLAPCRAVEVERPYLTLGVEGEALTQLLADLFVIERTGSVSERLWRLVTGQGDEDDAPSSDVIEAEWLGGVPPRIWGIVREAVLRCS